MKALVTGGGGFLGRAIALRLVSEGAEVSVLGRSDYPALASHGVRCVRADVADEAAVAAACAGQDVVFHTAARAGVWGPRQDYFRTNVLGTRSVLAGCRSAGVALLVHTSSPSVVFDGRDHEGAAALPYPKRYEATYPETKAAAEREVLAANAHGLHTLALRPHLIYGPADPHLLPRLFARAKSGRLAVIGNGHNRVSVTYVDNAAAAHVQAARAALAGRPNVAGRAFFVNDPEPVLLWPWIDDLLQRVGLPPLSRRVPLRVARAGGALLEAVWTLLRLRGEPPMTRFVASQLAASHFYDIAPARAAFDYDPPVSPEVAALRTAEYWRERV
ncbi:MAG: NAD-dependent epimerase/dehydratase family protein [Vicinamibacteria bacterium]